MKKRCFSLNLLGHVRFFMMNTPRRVSRAPFSNFAENGIMWVPEHPFPSWISLGFPPGNQCQYYCLWWMLQFL